MCKLMELLGLTGMLLFLSTSCVVAFRLLRLWTKTRQLPELMIGLSFLLAAGIGGSASVVGAQLRLSGSTLVGPLMVIGNLGIHAGVICLVVFVGSVFRPGLHGKIAVIGTGGALAVLGLIVASDPLAAGGVWNLSSAMLRIAVYTWAAAEAGLAWSTARKRMRLGFSDPATVDRFLLWSVGTGAIALLWLHTAYRIVLGQVAASNASYLIIAALGMVCAVSLWLAFFPPAAFQRRYQRTSSMG